MQDLNSKYSWMIFGIFTVIVLAVAGYYTYKFYQDLKTVNNIQSVADKSASDKESNSNSGLTKKVAFLEQSVEVEAPDYSHGKIWEYYFDTNKKEKILDGQSVGAKISSKGQKK